MNKKNIKVSIAYPPIETTKGHPHIAQNRQAQYFHVNQALLPVVMAYGATMLQEEKYIVYWNDGIAEEQTEEKFIKILADQNPDYIVIEGKTLVIKKYWEFTNKIKRILPRTKVIFVGDHVTALPEETLENCKSDYVLTGGDYDFLLINLINHINEGIPLEPGIWYKDGDKIKNTGKFQLNHDLNALPLIDRNLTNWELYDHAAIWFEKYPGFYIMAGRDCWWHKCTFCAWTKLYPLFRVRTPENIVDEVGYLIEKYSAKDIFDDTGAFPTGEWLRKFCNLMIEKRYNKKINISCNLRASSVTYDDCVLMKRAGFNAILVGLESANQYTLDMVNKGLEIEDMINSYKEMTRAGLKVHITIMFGYPWETIDDAKKTLNLAKYLLKKGIASTLQATVVVPYPGTPLFEYCKQNNLLKTMDWDDYDMSKSVMKSPVSDEDVTKFAQELYKLIYDPEFLFRKILKIRSINDIKFYFKLGTQAIGRIKDFRK